MPDRLQLSRRKGYRKPAGAIVCSRPGRWGNPFKAGSDDPTFGVPSSEAAVRSYRQLITQTVLWEWRREARRLLAGRDLLCWCPLDRPCHVDVLLAIANDWDLDGDEGSGVRRRQYDDWRLKQEARRAFLESVRPDEPLLRLSTYLSCQPIGSSGGKRATSLVNT